MLIAGVQKLPNANPPATTSNARSHAFEGQGSRIETSAEVASAARSGRMRPYRSDRRPSTGAQPASSAADTRYVAPTAAAPQPRSESRSGARTESPPNGNAGT